jgi:hypothetical protein
MRLQLQACILAMISGSTPMRERRQSPHWRKPVTMGPASAGKSLESVDKSLILVCCEE